MKPAPAQASRPPQGPPSAPTAAVRGARCPYGLGCVLRSVDPIHDKLWHHVALPAAAATAAPGAQQGAPSLLRRAVADGLISRSLKVRLIDLSMRHARRHYTDAQHLSVKHPHTYSHYACNSLLTLSAHRRAAGESPAQLGRSEGTPRRSPRTVQLDQRDR